MFMIVMGEVGAIAFTVNKVDSLRELVRHNVFKSLKLYGSSVTITNAWSLFQAEVINYLICLANINRKNNRAIYNNRLRLI